MTFRPRQFSQILDDMVNFVQANTRITDFSIGSVIRTILEASALEDDEQYFQMVQLLDLFNIRTSTGTDLDGRVAEYNIIRTQPTSSSGKLTVQDGSLITDSMAFDSNATDTTLTLESTTRFPVSGFPYIVRVGEDTVAVEDVAVSANDTGTGILTVAALTNDHSLGNRVSIVTVAADITISSGLQAQVAASGDTPATVFVTVGSGVIPNGNYESTPISAKALEPGINSNVGSGKITQFSSAPPFTGALVTNDTLFTGGRGVESDADLIDRATEHLQALGKGTPQALKEAVLGVTDPVTGQRVATASVLEKFSTDEVIIYIDDGSGFVPDQVVFARDSLDATYAAAVGVLSVSDSGEFPSEGFLLASPESVQAEVVEWVDVDYVTHDITLSSPTVNTHDTADEVVQVEVITASSEAGVDFFSLVKHPVARSSQRLWVGPSASSLTLQVEGTDYYLNKARGRIEFLSPLTAGSFIAIEYTYYVGLIFQAQRFVNGAVGDPIAFPGVVAAGIEATVETPAIRRITVRLSISVNDGFEEAALVPSVQTAIESYITALGIGDDVIVSEIVERAMGVSGMYNVVVQEPTSDLSVSSNELPVPTSASGTSLVVVS